MCCSERQGSPEAGQGTSLSLIPARVCLSLSTQQKLPHMSACGWVSFGLDQMSDGTLPPDEKVMKIDAQQRHKILHGEPLRKPRVPTNNDHYIGVGYKRWGYIGLSHPSRAAYKGYI